MIPWPPYISMGRCGQWSRNGIHVQSQLQLAIVAIPQHAHTVCLIRGNFELHVHVYTLGLIHTSKCKCTCVYCKLSCGIQSLGWT